MVSTRLFQRSVWTHTCMITPINHSIIFLREWWINVLLASPNYFSVIIRLLLENALKREITITIFLFWLIRYNIVIIIDIVRLRIIFDGCCCIWIFNYRRLRIFCLCIVVNHRRILNCCLSIFNHRWISIRCMCIVNYSWVSISCLCIVNHRWVRLTFLCILYKRRICIGCCYTLFMRRIWIVSPCILIYWHWSLFFIKYRCVHFVIIVVPLYGIDLFPSVIVNVLGQIIWGTNRWPRGRKLIFFVFFWKCLSYANS